MSQVLFGVAFPSLCLQTLSTLKMSVGHPYAAPLAMDHTLVLLKFIEQLEKPAKGAEVDSKAEQAKVKGRKRVPH